MSLESYYRKELERERDRVEKLRGALAEMVRCFEHDFEVNVIDAAVEQAGKTLTDTEAKK